MTDEDEAGLDQLAGAIVEGARVDWPSAESCADESIRPVIRELAVIAAIADVHCSDKLPAEPPAADWLDERSPETQPTWGAFRLLERVGEGAFGEVYRAWDTRLDREVALKLLPADPADGANATSVTEEGRLLARVRHPNVVTIYGAERIGSRIGLWMEFVNGRTLEQILEQGAVLSESETVAIGLELCRAVSAVHGAGLLHRDIKAHNVMRAEDGRIMLMDFGTGRKLEDAAVPELAGTPLYLAPEVLHGRPATVQSDLYSVGVLLYHLVSGSYPVRGMTVGEIRSSHERGERTGVQAARRDVSPKLASVIERAIDPRAEQRYESSDALRADLALVMVCSDSTGVGGVNLGPVEGPVIAVLPFKNLSAPPDSEYFVDGLTNEIIRNLAGVHGLRVLASTSSFAFRAQPRNLRRIGEQLGANLVVEGSVLRVGNRLRISAQLVQVAGDIPLWTDQFDRELEGIFSVQDEISRAIVNTLGLRFAQERQRHDTNLEAYDLYLKGRSLVARRGMPNAQMAVDLFQRAIAKDPLFAPAHAGLANAYAFWSFPYRGISFETAYPIMRPAAVKALQLDPELAAAHAAMGWVHSYECDWANAEQAFQQAIGLNPSLTQTHTSYSISTLQPLQKYDEALRLLHVAARHDPLSLDVQREIGEVQLFSGRYAEAVDTLQRVSEVEPDFPFVQAYLAKALIFVGRAEEAIQPLEVEQGSPWLAQAYVMTGRHAEAQKLAAESEAYPYRLAVIAAALGDTQRAIAALERAAVSEPHRIGRLLIEPELAVLRGHPRVVAIREAFNLP